MVFAQVSDWPDHKMDSEFFCAIGELICNGFGTEFLQFLKAKNKLQEVTNLLLKHDILTHSLLLFFSRKDLTGKFPIFLMGILFI